MASPTFHLLILLLGSLTIIPTIASTKPHPNLITRICKTTPYYNLCLSTLKSNPTSSKSDTKGLAIITLNAAASNATSTATYLSSQLLPPSSSTSSSDPASKKNKVLNLCAEKYSAATDSFHSSAQEVAAEMYDYAQIDAEAAAAYTDSCRNAFKRVGVDYPAEMVARQDSLKKISAVAVRIILDILNSSNPPLSKGDELH